MVKSTKSLRNIKTILRSESKTEAYRGLGHKVPNKFKSNPTANNNYKTQHQKLRRSIHNKAALKTGLKQALSQIQANKKLEEKLHDLTIDNDNNQLGTKNEDLPIRKNAERFDDLIGQVDYKIKSDKLTFTKPKLDFTDHNMKLNDIFDFSMSSIHFNEDHTEFYRQGFSISKIKKYLRRRGSYANLSVDIHYLNKNEASEYLTLAMTEAINNQIDCVKIIHGKGIHSDEKMAILKPFTLDFLCTLEIVTAVIQARQNDGGSGASYVLLKT